MVVLVFPLNAAPSFLGSREPQKRWSFGCYSVSLKFSTVTLGIKGKDEGSRDLMVFL